MSELRYVGIDLETNGSASESTGFVLEVAAVGLDERLNEIFRYSTPISQDAPNGAWTIMPLAVRDMHTQSGLIADINALASPLAYPLLDEMNDDGLFIHPYIDHTDELLAAVISDETDHKVILVGSGVSHYDHRWIKRHLPRVSTLLEHYTIDVGCMRRLYRAVVGDDLSTADSRKTHRALDDIDCHIEELIEFAGLFARDALLRDYAFAEPGEADCE